MHGISGLFPAAEAATAYDDMGSTAMDVIDTILADSDEPMLLHTMDEDSE